MPRKFDLSVCAQREDGLHVSHETRHGEASAFQRAIGISFGLDAFGRSAVAEARSLEGSSTLAAHLTLEYQRLQHHVSER